MPKTLTLTLPWPPTVNNYWRNVHGRTLISREGRQYRDGITDLWWAATVTEGRRGFADAPLAIHIDAYPPDNRRRDLDNLLKSLLDAMQHAGLYTDDAQIHYLAIIRHRPTPPGYVLVTLTDRLAHAPCADQSQNASCTK